MKLMVESTIRRNQALTKDIFQMDWWENWPGWQNRVNS